RPSRLSPCTSRAAQASSNARMPAGDRHDPPQEPPNPNHDLVQFDHDEPGKDRRLALRLQRPVPLRADSELAEFFVVLIAVYLGINVLFALLYFAAPANITNMPPNSLLDAFFFSVEKLATVGYGVMAAATRYGHVVATVEIFIGMMFTATMTGLVFVRFSKPKAKIIFADHPVITQHGGRTVLMVRVGNGRVNALTDAVARITVLPVETGPEGQHFRRALDLKLARPDLPFFPLTWTVMHELDASSPLHGLKQSTALAENLRMMLSITARDPSLGAQVYTAQGYRGSD